VRRHKHENEECGHRSRSEDALRSTIVSIVEAIDRGIVRDSFTPDCGMLEDRQMEERRDCVAIGWKSRLNDQSMKYCELVTSDV
jgi:hypothetical protein